MVMVVASFSATPVMFKLGSAGEAPFLFAGIWQGSVAVAVAGVMLTIKSKLLLTPEVIKSIGSMCSSWHMLVTVIGYCWFALLALGLSYVDISIAAILFETWPLFMILLASRLFRDSTRYRPVSVGTLIFVFLAIAGVSLVVLSHSESSAPLAMLGGGMAGPATLFGALLALMAAAGQGSGAASSVRLGTLLAKQLAHRENTKTGDVVFALVMTCIGHGLAGGALCLVGLGAGESLSIHQLAYAVAGGLLVNSIGTFAFRLANLKTKDLGVNAIAFATPLFALAWLWAFSSLVVPHLDYLIIGAMGIMAANLLINVSAEKRSAYSALVVCLWAFGTFVYFHRGYATNVPLELPVTVFILVLAFRVNRLVRRTGQEEAWMIDAFRRLRAMNPKNPNDGKASHALKSAWETLLVIDHHKSAEELKDAYVVMVEHLERARSEGCDAREITEIQSLIDNLSHSLQQGSRFGEIIAIFLAGALILVGLLGFNGDREIYSEITSFVLSSIMVFLFFNILDLQRDRKDKTLINGENAEYMVNFGEVKDREKQQYISMATSACIVVVFVVLFFVKQ